MSPRPRSSSLQIELEEDKLQRIEVAREDIGGELLSILSKGLYTNPLDSIREYIQNAVDAQAREVKIKITGNSIWVRDDGNGMSLAELVQARQFGVSRKSVFKHAGFRGIGIYSGFDLCERLKITTKKAGEDVEYVVVFDFGAMKKLLDSEREHPDGERTSIQELIYQNSFFTKHKQRKTAQFTIVQLEEISNVHLARFADREELRKYILQNVPVDFDEDFEHRAKIDKALRDNVEGYNAVRIVLQSDDQKDEVIAKPPIPNLYPPRMGFITDSRGEQIAYYWACLHKHRGAIKASGGEDYTDYQGFVYKCKGFTIGNREKLRTAFETGSSTLYDWYTGEIYVLDHRVLPNAERDDFEESAARQSLVTAVHDKLKGLETIADDQREVGLAEEKLAGLQEDLGTLGRQTVGDNVEAYVQLDKIMNEIAKRKKRVVDLRKRKQKEPDLRAEDDRLLERARDLERLADQLLKQGETLKRTLRRNIDEPKPRGRAKQAGAIAPQLPLVGMIEIVERQPAKETPKVTTLPEILATAGWKLDDNSAKIVTLLQSVLEDAFGVKSASYRRVMEVMDERVNDATSRQ